VFGSGQPGDQSESNGPEAGDNPADTSHQTSDASRQTSDTSRQASDTASRTSDTSRQASGASRQASDAGRQAGKVTVRPRPSTRVIAVGLAIAALIAAGVTYATQNSGTSQPAAAAAVAPAQTGPIHVVSITPTSRATGVNGAAPIVVTFSAPVAASTPRPQLLPSVAGTWYPAGNSLVFMPTVAFSPSERVTVSVPAGPDGVRSVNGGLLAASVTEQFTTGTYTQAALAELLAKLGYLPMTWAPLQNGGTRADSLDLANDPASQTPEGQAYAPIAATYQWDPGYPATLQQLWEPDQANVLLRGAVMAFESEHNMTIDGNLSPQLWAALFKADATGDVNRNGYTYAITSKGTPETLTIWHDGRMVFHSLANTGIPAAPTVDGTFPVYLRFLNTIMSGTNPDGSHYSDPVSFVSYFNGGDAVHYFPRGGYGYQQSLGCVELPYNAAEQAYPYLTYGSLVTVTG
jgi:Bacterial Ig-like domain/L,D-transpeptidase catalytic domain